jgi:rod shape determining protein RodA
LLAKLSFWRNFDLPLLVAMVLTTLFGIAMIRSATITDPQLSDLRMDWNQLTVGAGIGIVVFFLLARMDYHVFASIQLLLYVVCIAMLVTVEVVGITTAGSTRWMNIGPLRFQPSEPAKILVILVLARFYTTNAHRVKRLPVFVFSMFQILPIAALIFIEPDLGTTLVILAIWLGMTFAAGADWLHLLTLFIIAVPVVVLVWNLGELTGGKVQVFQQYQKTRFELFLDPYKDKEGEGYNLIQSRNSVESGGLTGQGYNQGIHNTGNFLKIRHADFIFSVIAEEWGFIGSLLVMTVLALIIYRVIYVATIAADDYGRFICAGVATMIFFQTFVNIGMNLAMMPVTGITLPLISHGSSSLWTIFMGLGLVQSVALRRDRDKNWLRRTGPARE